MKRKDNFRWLNLPAEDAAKRLLGCDLIREIDGQEVRVRIVETEAYDQADEASHTFKGRTKRNDAMFKSAGHLYVYFTYGIHYCCNVVCGEAGIGSGVLIRAVEPVAGNEIIESRRGIKGANAVNGPGKICQALDVDLSLTGHDLGYLPMRLIKMPPLLDSNISTGSRIGISKAIHELRRFYVTDSPYISKK